MPHGYRVLIETNLEAYSSRRFQKKRPTSTSPTPQTLMRMMRGQFEEEGAATGASVGAVVFDVVGAPVGASVPLAAGAPGVAAVELSPDGVAELSSAVGASEGFPVTSGRLGASTLKDQAGTCPRERTRSTAHTSAAAGVPWRRRRFIGTLP